MKRILIITLILLSVIKANSQDYTTESLENKLKTEKLAPDEELLTYTRLCSLYELNDVEKSLYYAQKGLNLAKKEKNKFRMMVFYNFLARYHSNKSEYESALENFKTALNLAIEIKDKEWEGHIYGNIAAFYCNKGDLRTGIEYYHKSISCLESIGNEAGYVMGLANIGGRYRQLGEYNLAMRNLKKAEGIAEKIKDGNALSKIYSSLGNLHWEMKELDKAMEYGRKALKVAQDMNHKFGMANAYQTLTMISIENKQYNEAEEFANECLRHAKELNNKKMILIAWNALSNVYLNQRRYKEAEAAAHIALETDSTNLYVGKSLLNNIIYSNIFLGNKEKAVEYLSKYTDINNEIHKKNVSENLIEMEVKYETEKKELQIASLEKEKQLYTWLGVAGLLFAATLGIVLWQNIRNSRKEKQLIATRSIMDGEMGERTRLARDLHDRLSGNLSAVKIGISNMESLQNVCEKLDSCIEEVRYVAHNLMPPSLQYGLRVALEDYAAQFPHVQFHFFGEDKRLEERKEYVIYCCASELVNNAIRHSGAHHINLQLIQDKKYISLTVQDDGCGFDEKAVSQGMGMKNIRDRVTSCNGKIDISTSPGKGTEITIELKTGNM